MLTILLRTPLCKRTPPAVDCPLLGVWTSHTARWAWPVRRGRGTILGCLRARKDAGFLWTAVVGWLWRCIQDCRPLNNSRCKLDFDPSLEIKRVSEWLRSRWTGDSMVSDVVNKIKGVVDEHLAAAKHSRTLDLHSQVTTCVCAEREVTKWLCVLRESCGRAFGCSLEHWW